MFTTHFQLKGNTPEQPKNVVRGRGQPTVMTADVLRRLEDAFSNGATDREAVQYAGIGLQTLYDYQERNPEYAEQKANFKVRITLKFRNTIANNVNDPKVAMWWLEKKDPELRPSSKLDLNATVKAERTPATPDIIAGVEAYEAARLEQIRAEAKKLLTPKQNEPSTAPPAGESGGQEPVR